MQLSWAELVGILRGFLHGPFRVDEDAQEPSVSFNVKPTQRVTMLAGGDGPVLTSARWWFVPHWFRGDLSDWKQTTFNARIETAAELPTFRAAWSRNRCAIPASGYFEWTGEKKNRLPWFITVDSNSPAMFFAGLSSKLLDGTRTCTILTRPALPQIAHLHDRVPVILTPDQIEPWISGDIGTNEARDTLGTGWDGRFKFHRVEPLKRDSDGPEVIEPIP